MTGGVPVAAGGYGCVFDPALKCKNPTEPYNPELISKLMIRKNAEDEKREIMRFAPILSTIPNAEKYFILNVNSCIPAPLTTEDLKDFDKKCRNFRNKPEFHSVRMRREITLNKLLILNMLNGGVDIDMYLTRKPVDSEKIYNLIHGIKDLINNAIIPMNQRGLYHLDLKPANIVIDRTNQMRIIDWGLSAIVKDTSKPVPMLAKPLQFNNPFYTVFANDSLLKAYNDFLITDENHQKELDYIVKSLYDYWEQRRGLGHAKYILMLFNDIYTTKKMTLADLREVVVRTITVMLEKNTDFAARKFDLKTFMETLYHNIDIWGALMSFGLLFYSAIKAQISLPGKKKEELLEKLKILLDSYLFFNFDKIDVAKLNDDLDHLLHFLKPEIDLSPNIAVTAAPKSNPPEVILVKSKSSTKKKERKGEKKSKSKKKKKLIILSNSVSKSPALPKIVIKKRQPRCPNGQRRNPKTGLCEPVVVQTKNPASVRIVNINPTRKNSHKNKSHNKTVKKRKPRCPNGQRRNPKTGLCEPFHN
jgi:serine/threonine protein kinase